MTTKDFIASAQAAYAPKPPSAEELANERGRQERRAILTGPCALCSWTANGHGWGYLLNDSRLAVGNCSHVEGQRYCDCCSEYWYAVGAVPSWDMDEDGVHGECEREDCPDCVRWQADQAKADAEIERDDNARESAEQQKVDEYIDRRRGVL